MDISYRRELDSNYLVIEDESFGTDQYTLRMLSENRPDPFLPLSLKQMNGVTSLWYRITSVQNMDRIFERYPMGGEDIRLLMEGYRNALECARSYLLETADIVLDPAFIFFAPDRQSVRFIYAPGQEGLFQGSLKKLLEYILRKLDHKDRRAVTLGYGLYESCVGKERAFVETWEELAAERETGAGAETCGFADGGGKEGGGSDPGRDGKYPADVSGRYPGRPDGKDRGRGRERRGREGGLRDTGEWEDSLTEDEYGGYGSDEGGSLPGAGKAGKAGKARKARKPGRGGRSRGRDGTDKTGRYSGRGGTDPVPGRGRGPDADGGGRRRRPAGPEGRGDGEERERLRIIAGVAGTILTGIVFGLIGWFTSLDAVQTGGLFFGTLAAAWLICSLLRNRQDPEKTIWGDPVEEQEEDGFWEALMCGEGAAAVDGLPAVDAGNDSFGPGEAGREYPRRIPARQSPGERGAGQTDPGRSGYLRQIEKEEAWIHGETRALGDVDRENRLVLVSQDVRRSRDLVLESAITLIGKSREMADAVIPLDVVSRVHARLDHTKDGIYLTDLNSRNGTFVNETRLEPNQRVAVAEGDRISFATVHFKLARRDY